MKFNFLFIIINIFLIGHNIVYLAWDMISFYLVLFKHVHGLKLFFINYYKLGFFFIYILKLINYILYCENVSIKNSLHPYTFIYFSYKYINS